jgi:hypothetical protein
MSHLTEKGGQYKSAFDVKSLSDLAIWYDFSDISSLDLSGNFIRKVNDKSGNNRNGYMSNLTTGYFYYDRMITGAWPNNTGFSAIDLSDVSFNVVPVAGSIFMAITPYEATQGHIMQTTTGTGAGKWLFSRGYGQSNIDFQLGGGTNTLVTGRVQNVRRTHIISAITDQTVIGTNIMIGSLNIPQQRLYVNGFFQGSAVQASNVWSISNVGVRFGNVTGGSGVRNIHHEVLVFSNAVDDITRCGIEEYLRKKWIDTIPVSTSYTSPIDLSGCVLWLDACDQSTLTYSGSSITKWADKSGNGYDASGIGTSNPIWDASRGGVRFLIGSRMFTTSPGPSNAETGFIVVDISGNIAGARARIIQTSDLLAREITIADLVQWQMTGNNITNVKTQQHYPRIKYAVSWRIDASANGRRNTRLAIDGVVERREIGVVNYPVSNVGVTTLGGSTTFQGVLHEVVLFNRELPDSDIMKINNYLMTKWNIPKYTNPITNSFNLSVSQDWPFCNQPVFQRPMYIPYDIKHLGAWYDAADPRTFDLSGTSIRSWKDKSGFQNDLSACVGGDLAYKALPTYLADTQEVDICGGFFRLQNINVSANRNLCNRPNAGLFSLFMVFKPNQVAGKDVSGSATSVFNMRNGTSNRFIHMPMVGGTAPNFSNGFLTYTTPVTGMPNLINIGTLSTTQYNILGACCGVPKYTITNNGTVTADLSGTNSLFQTQFGIDTVTNVGRTILAPEYFGGRIKEIMFFNRALPENDRQEIEYYLAKKWNLTSLLPSNHPGFNQRTAYVVDGFMPRSISIGNCIFWVDAATFNTSNYSNGQTITQWADKSVFNSPVDISGTLTYSTSYGVPGVNMCNGVAIARTNSSMITYGGTAFVVASLDSVTPGTPQYGVTMAPPTSLSNIARIMFVRSDTSLSYASLPAGTAVSSNFSCNTTSAGRPFIWETSFSNSVYGMILSNGTFPWRSAIHNAAPGISNVRIFLGCDASAANVPSWRGNIHEVILYNTTLGDWDRYNIRGYLAHKWKISNALPFGSPYGLVAP